MVLPLDRGTTAGLLTTFVLALSACGGSDESGVGATDDVTGSGGASTGGIGGTAATGTGAAASGGSTSVGGAPQAEPCPPTNGPCDPVLVVPGQRLAAGMRAYDGFLYFRTPDSSNPVAGPSFVWRAPLGGGPAENLATIDDPRAIAVGPTGVYVTSLRGLVTVPLTGGAMTILDSASERYWDLRIDETHAYYTNMVPAPEGGVYAIPLSGGAPTQLAALDYSPEIALNSDYVFATDQGYSPSAAGNIYRIPKAGGPPELHYGPSTMRPESLCADDSAIYWIEDQQINRLPNGATTPEILWSASTNEETGNLVVVGGALYWRHRDYSLDGGDRILRAGLDGSGVLTIVNAIDVIDSLVVVDGVVYFSADDDSAEPPLDGIYSANACGCPT